MVPAPVISTRSAFRRQPAIGQPLLAPASRACRRCRDRVRRPAAARGSAPPCARAPRSWRSTASAAVAWHHHDAVIVGDDQIAGMNELAGADDRHVDRAERFLDRALGGNRLGPDREAHFRSVPPRRGSRPRSPARARRAPPASRPAIRRNSRCRRARWARPPARRPRWHCSTATWSIQLSAGGIDTVTALPAILAPG